MKILIDLCYKGQRNAAECLICAYIDNIS